MEDDDCSKNWAQNEPKTADSALADLSELETTCTPSQLGRRDQAFAKARHFVDNARNQSLAAPFSRTFQNRGLAEAYRSARVDVEAFLGLQVFV
jgi:hypothetical protein